MAFINLIGEDEATGQIERVYAAGRTRAGSVANIIKVMSRDARSTQASMGMYVSLMKTDNALSPTRREMLATVVSNINTCYY